jgi:SAM-dependent methyltransferase
MDTAPPERCRLLDIGCGCGTNIIQAALRWPESTFIGLDIDRTAIDMATEEASDKRARNVRFLCQDVREGKVDGPFDYVTCHGVYSAVEPDVQQAILHACRVSLADQGAAYVAYSTLPGWRWNQATRDLCMGFAGRSANRARELLDFVSHWSSNAVAPDGLFRWPAPGCQPRGVFMRQRLPYQARFWASEHQRLHPAPDSYVSSEYLGAEPHSPLFFREFITRAAANGLRYLGEADVENGAMVGPWLPTRLVKGLRRFAGEERIAQEELLDYVTGRTMRQTILAAQAPA